nr:hypothetical protein BgiMline_021391 [Biomphalaria glabrata]
MTGMAVNRSEITISCQIVYRRLTLKIKTSSCFNLVFQISLSGNAKSKLSLHCSLDLTENLVLKSLNPNLVAAKVSESMKNVMNQERPSVKTKEVITVNTSLDLDTFSKLLPFLKSSNTTRLNETTDPTYSTNADGSMEKKILMVISICSTFLIAVALVCTGILIYIWKRVFNVGSGSSTAVQFSIQSNAVVCTSNAAEEIEIANSTEENHVYDSVIYTGYQTPKTTEGLTITINGTSTRIADQTETDPVYINMACQTIQPKSSECLIESIYKIPTNNAVRIFQPKTSESQTATIS